jgi:hypothetical protein
MKSFILLLAALSFNLNAQVSRSPAVVEGECDLNISTTKIKEGSDKKFTSSIGHLVVIRSNQEEPGCSNLPKKRYNDVVYEENAENEMKILFQKYPELYAKKCAGFYEHLGLKKWEYECVAPSIISMTFKGYGCNKNIEEETRKITYSSSVVAEIKYVQVGKRIEEKSVEVVHKEECTRVNECLAQASEKEIPGLKKLAAVACKGELVPVSTARAPAIEKDTSFDGNRKPKTNPNNEDKQNIPADSGSVLK